MIAILEMAGLSTVKYSDQTGHIAFSCFADTLVFNKLSDSNRELVAMRFGGYAEQVRAMADVIRSGVAIQADIDDHPVILKVKQKDFKRSVTHNGNYAEGMVMALDDDFSSGNNDEVTEKAPEEKRTMYIFCREGDTDELFTEIDRKISIPLIPDFKDYVLSECEKRGLLKKLKVLSSSTCFDAYQLILRNDEQDIESVVNDGLKLGLISIPNAVPAKELLKVRTVSEYLNRYGSLISL